MPVKWNNNSILGLGLVILLVVSLCSLGIGAYDLSLTEVGTVLIAPGSDTQAGFLIWQIRLPRLLLGILVGAGLAAAGAAVQGLFRNPLADPGLIGISGGSMLGAVSYIVLGSLLGLSLKAASAYLGLAVFAFAGSLLTTVLVYKLATFNGRTYTATMLLAGIAITAICGALVGLLTYFSTEDQLRDITFWSLGSLSGATWSNVLVLGIALLIALGLLLPLGKGLNALMLGEEEASYLGFWVQRIKWGIMAGTAIAVGVCVAMAGMIGFIGLVTPHLIRLAKGSDYRFLLPASAILGALLLLLADTLARTVLAPAELPIGILTSLIGAPFFFWLILKSRKKHSLIL